MTQRKFDKQLIELTSLRKPRGRSRSTSSSRSISFLSSHGTNGYEPQDHDVLIRVKKAVIEAANDYLNYHKDKNPTLNRGHHNGFFSMLRHGPQGKASALDLLTQVKIWEYLADAITALDLKLCGRNTRYHIHSLASYIIDKMSTVAKECNSSLILGPDPDTKRYVVTAQNKPLVWGLIKEELEKQVDVHSKLIN